MLFALKVLLAYCVGSINGGLVLGRFRGVDIRRLGSGNAGGTNAFRTQGALFALGVILIDVGKGALAASLIADFGQADAVTPLYCAAAAVIGHVYPLWFGFRGGKGAATLVGAVAVLHWQLLLPLIAAWLLIVVLSGYVGLATMLATAALALHTAVLGAGLTSPFGIFSIAMTLLIVFTHRSNIARMLAGTESRATRLWLFGRRH